jgi:uncharacterized protein YbaA (DUF1428 family)
MADDRLRPDGPLPFNGKRMIYAGFEADFDTGPSGKFGYVDGMVASLPDGSRRRFILHSAEVARLFQETGAHRIVDGWGVDVPAGKVTDFKRAVRANDGETVVLGWIEWPDKWTCDAGMNRLMQDPRMRDASPPWNGKLAIFAGFTPILDIVHV